jgi:hypothetical protein
VEHIWIASTLLKKKMNEYLMKFYNNYKVINLIMKIHIRATMDLRKVPEWEVLTLRLMCLKDWKGNVDKWLSFPQRNLVADTQTVVVLFVLLCMVFSGYNRFGGKCYARRHGHFDPKGGCSVFFRNTGV